MEPSVYDSPQSPGQLIAPFAAVTDPEPEIATDSGTVCAGSTLNCALMVLSPLTTKEQLPSPWQLLLLPLHPMNWYPDAGTAFRETAVLMPKSSAQSPPQAMPAGAEVTVPDPLESTVTRAVAGFWTKVAETERSTSMVIVQEAAVWQAVPAPDHAENCEVAELTACNVTCVPAASLSSQSVPQLMPAGLDVTLPSPALLTKRVVCGPVPELWAGASSLPPQADKPRDIASDVATQAEPEIRARTLRRPRPVEFPEDENVMLPQYS